MTAFNHKNNLTKDMRKIKKKNNKLDFYNLWDDDFQMFVTSLKNNLLNY